MANSDGKSNIQKVVEFQQTPWGQFWTVARIASTGVSAWHGYKRNNSVGWAIWWGILGGFFPIITPAIGFAQGLGKRRRP